MKTVEYFKHQMWMRSAVFLVLIISLSCLHTLTLPASAAPAASQSFDDLYFQSLINSSSRQYNEALLKLQQAIKLRPNDPDCLEAIASTYVHLRKHSEAIPFARKAAALDKHYEQARQSLATALMATGELKEGIKYCKEVLALNPDNRTCKSYLIVAEQKLRLPLTNNNSHLLEQDKRLSDQIAQFLQDSKWAEGINLLNSYILSHPQDYTAYLKRAYFNECQRNQIAAINDYTKVLSMYPCQRNALESRAQAYLSRKQAGKAVGDFTKLMRVSPHHWNIRYRLAYALLEQKAWAGALREYNGLLLVYPHSVEALIGRSQVFLATGKTKLAIADIKKAISYSPERSASYHYKLGIAYKKLGDTKSAKDEISLSKKMGYDPKDF